MPGEEKRGRIFLISHLFTGVEPWLFGKGKTAGMPGVTNLIKGLVSDDYICTWLILTGEEKETVDPLEGVDVKLRRLPFMVKWLRTLRPTWFFESLSFFPLLLWGIWEVLRLSESGNPDLLYVEGSRGFPWIGFFSSKFRSVPMVTRIYGTPLGRLLDRPHARLRMVLTRFSDSICFLAPTSLMIITDDGTRGNEVAHLFNAPRGGRLLFLRNGIDHIQRSSQIPHPKLEEVPPPKRLIWVSRFDHWKRVDRSIRSMQTVIKNDPDAVLFIVGYGSAEKELKGLVEDLELEGRVIFLGRLPMEDVRTLLAQSHLYISTYGYLANVSNTMLEAMSDGCCIVTLDDGSTRRIITRNITGYLVDPVIKDETLGEFIGKLLQNNQASRKAGKRAQKVARNMWSWSDRIGREISAISHLLKFHRKR